MQASLYARMQYVTPQDLPGGWPIAPALYDHKMGLDTYTLVGTSFGGRVALW